MGREALVPSLLILGSIKTFPVRAEDLPGQKEHLEVMEDTPAEMIKTTFEIRFRNDLTSKLPLSLNIISS